MIAKNNTKMMNRVSEMKRKQIGLMKMLIIVIPLVSLVTIAPAIGGLVSPSTPGLVRLYYFDEGSGTIATDSSGGGYHGTIYGGAGYTTDSADGAALSFDGGNDYVSTPSISFPSGDFTIAAWFKGFVPIPYYSTIVGKTSGTANGYWDIDWVLAISYDYGAYGGRVLAQTGKNGTGGGLTLFGVKNIGDNQWHHIVYTKSGDNVKVYVDGEVDAMGFLDSLSLRNSSWPVRIGWGYHTTTYTRGIIDEVAIYNRGLSPEEIRELEGSIEDDSECQAQLAVLEQEKDALEQEVASLSADKQALLGQVGTLQLENQTLQGELNAANLEIASLENQITTLQNNLTTANGTILALTNELNSVKAERDQLQALLTQANQTIAGLQGTISAQELTIANQAGIILGLQNDLASANTQIQTLNATITTLQSQIVVAGTALAEIQALIATPQGRRTSASDYSGAGVLGGALNDILKILLAPPGQNIRSGARKE